MPDFAANPSLETRWRPWHVLALLVAAHALFNIISNPMSEQGPDEFPKLLWVGAFLAQPVLVAAWMALGPPPATKRIPFSIAAFMLLVLASCVPQLLRSTNNSPVMRPGLDDLMMPAMLFAAALIAMFPLRFATGWRIANARRTMDGTWHTNQFSIKYLFVLTAVCAVALGIGRAMASAIDWSDYPSWQDVGVSIAMIWILFVAMTPAIVVTIVALSPRPTGRMVLTTIASSGILSLIVIETIILIDSPPRGEVSRVIILIQLGAVLASLASALVLRRAGYRSLRRPRTIMPAT